MTRKKISCLVGGAGFIGNGLIRVLSKTNREILSVDKKDFPKDPLNNCRYISADCSNIKQMENILQNVDEVIHLAYTTNPKTSYDNPIEDFKENLEMGVNVMEVAVKMGVRKFVLVSSGGAVYGKADRLPISEDFPTNPISPYGISKLTLEKYALMLSFQKKLNVVIVRPGNAYGEYQIPYKNLGFIINAVASVIDNKEIVIFGKKGTVRDYIYVQDLVRGIVKCLDKGLNGEIYNIGTSIGTSNFEVLNVLIEIARKNGYKPRIRIEKPRIYDVPKNVLDITKIKKQTGWVPEVSLKDGIKRTWDWYIKMVSESK